MNDKGWVTTLFLRIHPLDNLFAHSWYNNQDLCGFLGRQKKCAKLQPYIVKNYVHNKSNPKAALMAIYLAFFPYGLLCKNTSSILSSRNVGMWVIFFKCFVEHLWCVYIFQIHSFFLSYFQDWWHIKGPEKRYCVFPLVDPFLNVIFFVCLDDFLLSFSANLILYRLTFFVSWPLYAKVWAYKASFNSILSSWSWNWKSIAVKTLQKAPFYYTVLYIYYDYF